MQEYVGRVFSKQRNAFITEKTQLNEEKWVKMPLGKTLRGEKKPSKLK